MKHAHASATLYKMLTHMSHESYHSSIIIQKIVRVFHIRTTTGIDEDSGKDEA